MLYCKKYLYYLIKNFFLDHSESAGGEVYYWFNHFQEWLIKKFVRTLYEMHFSPDKF